MLKSHPFPNKYTAKEFREFNYQEPYLNSTDTVLNRDSDSQKTKSCLVFPSSLPHLTFLSKNDNIQCSEPLPFSNPELFSIGNFGLLIQNHSQSSPTAFSPDPDASFQPNFPTPPSNLYSLSHPLKELCPVALKSNEKLRYFNHSKNHRIIATFKNFVVFQDICLQTFHGCILLTKIRKVVQPKVAQVV